MRPKNLKFTFQEQKDYAVIDGLVEAAEGEIAVIEQQMADSGSDAEGLQVLCTQLAAAKLKLASLMDRWTYLTELEEKINENNQ